MSMLRQLPRSIVVHSSVKHALSTGAPVVALESTILTHGLPYPTSLECGLALHAAVRENGATPATIALLDGKVHVGISDSALDRLCRAGDAKIREQDGAAKPIKTGERDIATALAQGKNVIGGTTVSGTLFVAHLLKIDIFATGGIGGVHRGAQDSMDISSDLPSLARHPVGLFCSGAKSILDIPRTLEYLETQGVPISTFHPAGLFPAFYTADSGCKVNAVADEAVAARALAEAIGMRAGFGMPSWAPSPGHLLGVPIPARFEEVGQRIQAAVEQAVAESVANGVDRSGKEATPWLLQRVSELSGGDSLPSNVGLVVNNATKAARTAVILAAIKGDYVPASARSTLSLEEELFNGTDLGHSKAKVSTTSVTEPPSILVFGLGAIDVTSSLASSATTILEPATYPGQVELGLGGVGRNVAEAAQSILGTLPPSTAGGGVQLIAPIGSKGCGADAFGELLRDGMTERGMRTDGLFRFQHNTARARTPVCSLVLSGSGELVSGVADMDLASTLDAARVSDTIGTVGEGASIAFDANLSIEAMQALLVALADKRASVVLYEPTSVLKSLRLLEAYARCRDAGIDPHSLHVVQLSTPNVYELTAMHARAVELDLLDPTTLPATSTSDDELCRRTALPAATLLATRQLTASHLLGPTILLKLGSHGVLSARAAPKDGPDTVELQHHPIPSTLSDADGPLNTTGAGDTFAGVVLAAAHVLARAGADDARPAGWSTDTLANVVLLGQRASALTLRSARSVSPVLGSALGQEAKEVCVP